MTRSWPRWKKSSRKPRDVTNRGLLDVASCLDPNRAPRPQEIIRYIAERSPAAARVVKDVIEAAPLSAAMAPYLYRPGRVPGTREIAVHPNCIVVYTVTNHIEVLNVLHSRQCYPFE